MGARLTTVDALRRSGVKFLRKIDDRRSADVAYLRLVLVLSDDRLRCDDPMAGHWMRLARRRGSWQVLPSRP